MPIYYFSLVNLEIEAETAEDAGSIASVDVVTGPIIEYLGKEFRLILTTAPINVEATPNKVFSIPPKGDDIV